MSPALQLALLTLGLTLSQVGAEHAVTCASIKPLADLNVREVCGDWIVLARPILENGTVPPPYSETGFTYTAYCITLDISADPGDRQVTLKMKVRTSCNNTVESTGRMDVVKGARWVEVDDPAEDKFEEYLVVAAVPDKYLVLVGCEGAPRSESLSPARLVDDVMVLSRYSPGLGRLAVSDLEYGQILEDTARALGVSRFSPLVHETGCFSDQTE